MALCLASRKERECGESGSESEPIYSCLRNLGGVWADPRLQLQIGDSSDNRYFDKILSHLNLRFPLLKKSFRNRKKSIYPIQSVTPNATLSETPYLHSPMWVLPQVPGLEVQLCQRPFVLEQWRVVISLGAGCNWKLTQASLVQRFPNCLVSRGSWKYFIKGPFAVLEKTSLHCRGSGLRVDGYFKLYKRHPTFQMRQTIHSP